MSLETPRLRREFKTMRRMVEIHCRDHHGTARPCPDCEDFLAYAEQRLEKCPYGEAKPTCAKCPVHCYRKQRREQARGIMQYSGPRMMLRHPWLALMHILDKFRKVRHPMELRGSRRKFTNAPRS
ncbi:MAG TPA: nitrous oxide-stimulated promoter family protein [Wenzhouxiangellaceae bacterium]|nr:nitrous oxide-stimulated promoter family protein [Wenzhouxiangellaceae bacterium]